MFINLVCCTHRVIAIDYTSHYTGRAFLIPMLSNAGLGLVTDTNKRSGEKSGLVLWHTASMKAETLYDKLWNEHIVTDYGDGACLLYIDRHLVHEVTSPQAFEGLKLAGREPWRRTASLAVPGSQRTHAQQGFH